MANITKKASAFVENIRNTVNPKLRRERAAKQLRIDFYNGELVKKQRGGRGVTDGYQSEDPSSLRSIDSYRTNDIDQMMYKPETLF